MEFIGALKEVHAGDIWVLEGIQGCKLDRWCEWQGYMMGKYEEGVSSLLVSILSILCHFSVLCTALLVGDVFQVIHHHDLVSVVYRSGGPLRFLQRTHMLDPYS